MDLYVWFADKTTTIKLSETMHGASRSSDVVKPDVSFMFLDEAHSNMKGIFWAIKNYEFEIIEIIIYLNTGDEYWTFISATDNELLIIEVNLLLKYVIKLSLLPGSTTACQWSILHKEVVNI